MTPSEEKRTSVYCQDGAATNVKRSVCVLPYIYILDYVNKSMQKVPQDPMICKGMSFMRRNT